MKNSENDSLVRGIVEYIRHCPHRIMIVTAGSGEQHTWVEFQRLHNVGGVKLKQLALQYSESLFWAEQFRDVRDGRNECGCSAVTLAENKNCKHQI
jgi:hypothetical protein